MVIKFNPRFKDEVTSEWVAGLNVNPEDLHYTVDEVKRFFGMEPARTFGTIWRDQAKALKDAENLNGYLKYFLKDAYEDRDDEIAAGRPPFAFSYGYGVKPTEVNKKNFPTAANESVEEVWDNYIHDLRALQGTAALVELKRKIVEENITEIE